MWYHKISSILLLTLIKKYGKRWGKYMAGTEEYLDSLLAGAKKAENKKKSDKVTEKKEINKPTHDKHEEAVFSDSDRMTTEEIDALLASVGKEIVTNDNIEISEETKTKKEELVEEKVEEVVEENVEEEAYDPNKPMSPEDIAKLIGQMNPEETAETETPAEEVVEEKLEEEAYDPNKPMSPEDIAKLIGQMNPEETAETEKAAEAAEEVVEEKVEEEAYDPNKPMSPDDIANLIGSLKPEEDSLERNNGENEKSEGILSELNAMEENDVLSSDFSEEDIEKMLNSAENVNDDNPAQEMEQNEQSVDELLSMLGEDNEAVSDIGNLLEADKNSEIVDESTIENFEKAQVEATENTTNDEEVASDEEADKNDSEKKKKIKKKDKTSKKSSENDSEDGEKSEEKIGLFARLFGKKKNKKEISDDDNIENGVTKQGESESKVEGNDASEDVKTEKKQGFFARLLNAITEEVDEDGDRIIPEASEINLSDENQAILEALEGEEEKGGKKKKGKKEKKPKAKKEKKEKKEKKPKKPKKDDGADKEAKDSKKKIPSKYVAATAIAAASLFVVILVPGLFMPKKKVMAEAREAYYKKDYKTAFFSLYGKKLNESDQLLYDKSKLIVLLDRKYEAYLNYKKMNMKEEELDSLFSGLEKYYCICDYGNEIGVLRELDEIKNKLLDALESEYGISEEMAKEILEYSDVDYSRKIKSLVSGEEFQKMDDILNDKYHLNKNETQDKTESAESGSENEMNLNEEYPDLLPMEEDYLLNKNNIENVENAENVENTEGNY